MRLTKLILLSGVLLFNCNCTSLKTHGDKIVVSVVDQKLSLIGKEGPIKTYPISTSKYGLGSQPNSYRTPLGRMYVCKKIGSGARPGTVFKSRRPTGEVVKPNSPGRDPIISRIIWLEGLERYNHNTKERLIYIHGTPEERTIGSPTSYGCVRMKSKDIIDLYDRIRVGTLVYIKRGQLTSAEIPLSQRFIISASQSNNHNHRSNQFGLR
ncbi:MAG: L,D-transpeptidase [Verrucomicrobiota bacterium]|jgi:lipoprotein-anchoring transpeptidase ErfK/SrfK|nr:L,D-transpeptidase [Verrucomicrobiota bacterium]MEC8690409.1 L,D-transpeptidase [Verrucomicrobiota bacterium]